LPDEAEAHADAIFLGPADEALPRFLQDYRSGHPQRRYVSTERQIETIPRARRDLIKRNKYLVPNSLVVSRGCPHHCDFCYKDGFYSGGKSFYTTRIDSALEEIDSLPGRHLYFLDDHLFGNGTFAGGLFDGMAGMNRIFQGAATVDSILKGDLLEKAAAAGLRSLFVGFETFSEKNLKASNNKQNSRKRYEEAFARLHALGIMINGSFVFGMDDDDREVFRNTVDWAVRNSITTCTFHIMTPYPGTPLFKHDHLTRRIFGSYVSTYDFKRSEEDGATVKLVYENRGEKLGIARRASHLPNQLSGGERQRVAIGRSIVMKPAILLADEPTGNLDSRSGAEVTEILENLNQEGITLLVVTHDNNMGERARRRIRMVDGAIASDLSNDKAA